MPGNAITLDQMATLFNDELNALSTTLSYNIILDINDWFKEDKADKLYSATVVTPGVLYRDVEGDIAPSQQFAQISEQLKLSIKGFNKDLDELKTLISTWSLNNSGKQDVIDTWRIQRAYKTPIFSEVYHDEGEDRINIDISIGLLMSFNGVTSEDVSIKVNELELPILTFAHTINKEGASDEIITKPTVNSSWFTTRSMGYSMTFRYLKDNDTMNEIVEDIKTGQFLNRPYSVVYDDGQSNDILDMTISNGSIQYTTGGFLTINATFIEYMPGLES